MWREKFLRGFYLFTQPFHRGINSIKDTLLRSIITISIVAIAISAIISIQITLNGLSNNLLESFNSFGINQLELSSHYSEEKENLLPVSENEAVRIVTHFCEDYQVGLLCKLTEFISVKGGKGETEPIFSISAMDYNYLVMSGLSLRSGSFFTNRNLSEPVAIVGPMVSEELFDSQNPIGEKITIGKSDYRIIALLNDDYPHPKFQIANTIILPISYLPNIPLQTPLDYRILFATDGNIESLSVEVENMVLRMRGKGTLQEAGLEIVRGNSIVDSINSLNNQIAQISTIIALILLFGSMISLMNIILVSYREKSQEIIIERAVGAPRRAVMMQFLFEAILLAQIGTFIGILSGTLIGFIISNYLQVQFVMPWDWVLKSIAITLIISIISGLMPLLKYSRKGEW